MTTATRIETEADTLRRMLPPGTEVRTILRHVSRSGMMRHISIIINGEDKTYWVARVLNLKRAEDGGVKVGGVGMDMGYSLVYDLSTVLYPTGFECAGERCPACDHHNGDRDYSPHHHRDGGYAIRQRWL